MNLSGNHQGNRLQILEAKYYDLRRVKKMSCLNLRSVQLYNTQLFYFINSLLDVLDTENLN